MQNSSHAMYRKHAHSNEFLPFSISGRHYPSCLNSKRACASARTRIKLYEYIGCIWRFCAHWQTHICSSRTEESGKWFIFCAFAHYLWRLFPLECLIGVPLMSLSCYFNQMPREMEEFHINRRHIWEMNGKCFAYGFISIFIFIESYHSDVFVFSSAKLIHDELERKSQHTTH